MYVNEPKKSGPADSEDFASELFRYIYIDIHFILAQICILKNTHKQYKNITRAYSIALRVLVLSSVKY